MTNNTFSPVCAGQTETIYLLLDGALSPPAEATFRQHLATCPACQTALAESETLFANLVALEPINPPPGLTETVMAHLPPLALNPVTPSPVARPYHPSRGWFAWLNSLQHASAGLILVIQLVIGLRLVFIAAPALTPTYPSIPAVLTQFEPNTLPQPDLIASTWTSIFQKYTTDIWSTWLWAESTATQPWPPEIIVTFIIGVGLAWFISNRLLLNPKIQPINHGGRL